MDAGQALWPLAQLRAVAPQVGYAYRGRVPGHGKSNRHTPAWCSCWLIDAGWAEVQFDDGRQARAEPGEWLLCPPMATRYQIFPAEAEILSLSFHLPFPPEVDLQHALPRVVGSGVDDPLRPPAERMIAELGGHTDLGVIRYRHEDVDLGRWLRAQHHLTAFVAAWHDVVFGDAPEAQAIDQRVREAQQVLASRPRMGPVPYDVLQARTGLGQVQLDRLFKQALGRSPKQELDRLCLERVLRRLDDPGRPVKAIASELGFTDSSHLCRWFAKRTGLSPQRYRREGAV